MSDGAAQVSDPLSVTETKLAKRWVRKTLIFMAIFVVLFVWGLYDATMLYPKRGRTDAEYRRFAYLQEAERERRLAETSIADPATRYEELAGRQLTSDFDRVKLEWLQALSRVGMLTPEHTTFANPTGELVTLREQWKAKDKPNPLSSWDIPFQWALTFVGAAGAVWVAIGYVRAKGQVYRWDPAAKRLTMPGGVSLTPADIAELDKRKWHKFFVTIITTGDQKHELDLYKHEPLEEWVLEMENVRFPEPIGGIDVVAEEPANAPQA